MDYHGQALAELPLGREVPRLTRDHIAAILVVECGMPGAPEWFRYVAGVTGIPMAAGEPGLDPGEIIPYVSPPAWARMQGLRPCAEYEYSSSWATSGMLLAAVRLCRRLARRTPPRQKRSLATLLANKRFQRMPDRYGASAEAAAGAAELQDVRHLVMPVRCEAVLPWWGYDGTAKRTSKQSRRR